MVFKKLFKGKGEAASEPARDDDELTIEDLIVLERYQEAQGRLEQFLKANPDDLHGHLKLADVYHALGRGGSAADEYVFVADEYGRDGFYDKGMALLNRALKLTPGEERLRLKLYALEKAKGLEHKRQAAIDGLRQSRLPDGGSGTKILHLQRGWLDLATSPLMQRLSVDQLRRFFSAVEVVKVKHGERLAERGSNLAALHVLVAGTVEASLQRAGGQRTLLRTYGPGDLLGEAATLERGVWPAEYRVGEDGLVLRLDRAGIEHCLAGNPDPRGFLEALRTDANDRQIAEMVSKLEGKTA